MSLIAAAQGDKRNTAIIPNIINVQGNIEIG